MCIVGARRRVCVVVAYNDDKMNLSMSTKAFKKFNESFLVAHIVVLFVVVYFSVRLKNDCIIIDFFFNSRL